MCVGFVWRRVRSIGIGNTIEWERHHDEKICFACFSPVFCFRECLVTTRKYKSRFKAQNCIESVIHLKEIGN